MRTDRNEARSALRALELRAAAEDDTARIGEIIRDVRRRMRERGSDQWQNGYPAPEDIARDIRRDCGRVLCEASRIVAYAAVDFDGEPAYAHLRGTWRCAGPYVVVHRLAVAGEALGRGIAEEFLRRIAALAAARGTASFRIDTNFDNTPMLRVLRRAGFAHCGTIDYDGAERLAFEKALE